MRTCAHNYFKDVLKFFPHFEISSIPEIQQVTSAKSIFSINRKFGDFKYLRILKAISREEFDKDVPVCLVLMSLHNSGLAVTGTCSIKKDDFNS